MSVNIIGSTKNMKSQFSLLRWSWLTFLSVYFMLHILRLAIGAARLVKGRLLALLRVWWAWSTRNLLHGGLLEGLRYVVVHLHLLVFPSELLWSFPSFVVFGWWCDLIINLDIWWERHELSSSLVWHLEILMGSQLGWKCLRRLSDRADCLSKAWLRLVKGVLGPIWAFHLVVYIAALSLQALLWFKWWLWIVV